MEEKFKSFKSIKGDPRHLEVYWVVTRFCNFSCNYCGPQYHRKDKASLHALPLEKTQSVCKWFNDLAEEGRKITIVLSGGEPTTYEHIDTIFSTLNPKIYLSIITNGSRPLAWWQKQKRLPDEVVFSVHEESNVDKILDLADYIRSRAANIAFNCCMDMRNWEASCARYEKIKERYGNKAIRKVINDLGDNNEQKDPQPYTDEQRKYLLTPDSGFNPDPEWQRKHTENWLEKTYKYAELEAEDGNTMTVDRIRLRNWLIRNNLNHYHNWLCSAGQQSITIQSNGVIYAGFCGIFPIATAMSPRLLDRHIVCTRSTCVCPSDQYITKFKPS